MKGVFHKLLELECIRAEWSILFEAYDAQCMLFGQTHSRAETWADVVDALRGFR